MHLQVAIAAIKGDLVVYTNRGDLIDNGSFKKWIAAFKNKYPTFGDIKLKRSDNFEVESVKLFAARQYGDVTLIPENLPKDVYPNYFEPLNNLGLSKHLYFADAWAYQGKEYAYSQGVSVEGLVYNKAVFKKLGLDVPQTLTELYKAAAVLKQNGVTPLSLNIGSAWPLQQWDKAPVLIAGNANYYNEMLKNEAPYVKNGAFAQSLNIPFTFYQKGWSEDNIIDDNWENSKAQFVKGKAAMYFLGSWVIPQLIDKGLASKDVGFAPFPFTNNTKTVGLVNKDWGLGVSRYSKNKIAAKAWLKFLLTESDFADMSGFIPTDKRKKPNLRQMREFQSYQPEMIQAKSPSFQFIRLTNMAGIDFMRGGYIRNIILSSDFDMAINYWDRRWALALKNGDDQ